MRVDEETEVTSKQTKLNTAAYYRGLLHFYMTDVDLMFEGNGVLQGFTECFSFSRICSANIDSITGHLSSMTV